jgi:hypothetical protein
MSRRRIIAVAAGLLFVGAFLMWGPIGLGNGPLRVNVHGAEGWTDVGQSPVGFVIPISNSGGGRAVIDGVEVVGGTNYSGPRELGVEVLSSDNCGGAQAARAAGRAFVLVGCGGREQGALIGRGVGSTRFVAAAAEVAAPRPGSCWAMTKIVIYYHVGIRHYAATDPYELAVCGRGTPSVQVLAAMHASDGASP